MISFPNAKINIGLNITKKRSDGYHNLETIFYPVNLCDILEFVENKENTINFGNSGIIVDTSIENNLIVKAYELLKSDFNLPGLDIHLHKVIPYGAGLGGGSSDAAFMLKMLNTYFDLSISIEKLKNYASQLGSDCAFFIENRALFASGTGNIFSETKIDLKDYYVYLIKPDLGIKTNEAFSKIKVSAPIFDLKKSVEKEISFWKEEIKNDFEEYALTKIPDLQEIITNMYKHGAKYVSMSGSGSSIFGIFEKEAECIDVYKKYFSFIGKF